MLLLSSCTPHNIISRGTSLYPLLTLGKAESMQLSSFCAAWGLLALALDNVIMDQEGNRFVTRKYLWGLCAS